MNTQPLLNGYPTVAELVHTLKLMDPEHYLGIQFIPALPNTNRSDVVELVHGERGPDEYDFRPQGVVLSQVAEHKVLPSFGASNGKETLTGKTIWHGALVQKLYGSNPEFLVHLQNTPTKSVNLGVLGKNGLHVLAKPEWVI